jgi:hypothetical protein
MKIMVQDKDYRRLAGKASEPVEAVAANDFVSTMRLDATGQKHQYESRRSVMKAFLQASKSKVVSVVCGGNNSPIKAKVSRIGGVCNDGLGFRVRLAREAS